MRTIFVIFAFVIPFIATGHLTAEDIFLKSKNTLTVVEANSGDVIRYEMKDGREVHIEVLESESSIVLTTLDELKKGSPSQRTIFAMKCRVRIDGQEMDLVRYNPVQEAFYEPYTVNGLNIWFDAVRSLENQFRENHGKCLPGKEVRVALQDADRSVCPEPLANWMPVPDKRLDIHNCYGGEDTWLGPYFGADLHGGLDINVPSNTTLCAPIDFDEQFYFASLKNGQNNNRWRGIRSWENGDVWHLQTHHLVEALVPENTPLAKGTAYAYAGGVYAGYTSHVHFVFKVQQPGMDWMLIDPWILFWQTFRENQEAGNKLLARMKSLAPSTTGEVVAFSSSGSRMSVWGQALSYYWDFGDGTIATEASPEHVYSRPGIYPVTLFITDQVESASCTQHITVNGSDLSAKSISLRSSDPFQFQPTASWKSRAWGDIPTKMNHVIFHGYRKQEEPFTPQKIQIVYGENLDTAIDKSQFDIKYIHGDGWLELDSQQNSEGCLFTLRQVFGKLIRKHGFYEAEVRISNTQAVNTPITLKVFADFRFSNPGTDVIISHGSADAEKSDFFWVEPAFHIPWVVGHNGRFLVNADGQAGEYVRFRPNLIAGRYRVELFGPAYEQKVLLDKTDGFNVRIRHRDGVETVWVKPGESLNIGEFNFSQGREGYVELLSDGARGLILVDAIRFTEVVPPVMNEP